MPTVEVYNGDLEDALAVFKQKTNQEGIIGEYKRNLAFISANEERKQKHYRQEQRERRKEARRKREELSNG